MFLPISRPALCRYETEPPKRAMAANHAPVRTPVNIRSLYLVPRRAGVGGRQEPSTRGGVRSLELEVGSQKRGRFGLWGVFTRQPVRTPINIGCFSCFSRQLTREGASSCPSGADKLADPPSSSSSAWRSTAEEDDEGGSANLSAPD